MVAIKQSWLRRSLAFLLIVAMILSMGVINVFAAESSTETANLIEVTVILKTIKITE